MNPVRMVRRFFERTDGEESRYRCIRCGAEFDTNHFDCPSCGLPYVTEVEQR